VQGGLHLYVIQSATTGAIKIGRSSDPERRLRDLQTGSPFRLKIILVIEGGGWRESELHQRLRRYRSQGTYKGEWFIEPALGELPNDIYERLDLDDVNTWWVTDAGAVHFPGPPQNQGWAPGSGCHHPR